MDNGHRLTIRMDKHYGSSVSSSTRIVWEIDNFSLRPERNGVAFLSPKFETPGQNGEKLKWILFIYPNGIVKTPEYVSLYIKMEKGGKMDRPAQIRFAILNARVEEKHKKELSAAECFWGFRSFIKRDFLMAARNGLLPGDRLTILCQLDITEQTANTTNIPPPQFQLAEDIANLWEKELFTDCALATWDNREFQAHKFLLACRSPVFAAMFQDGTIEAQKSRVDIDDIDGNVLEQLLHYIYTGIAPNFEAMPKELMMAADKYQIWVLKALCERALALSVNKENACELLALADLYSAAHLKSEAIKFIKSHAHEVIGSAGWKMLAKGHPHLGIPLFEAIASRKRKFVD